MKTKSRPETVRQRIAYSKQWLCVALTLTLLVTSFGKGRKIFDNNIKVSRRLKQCHLADAKLVILK